MSGRPRGGSNGARPFCPGCGDAFRRQGSDRVKHQLASVWGKVGNRPRGLWAPVLCYHSVNDQANPDCDPLPRSMFEQHLDHLKRHYQVVTVDALVKGLYAGAPLPPRPVAITFDDGYEDNYSNAFPLLKKYELPATIFLVTE